MHTFKKNAYESRATFKSVRSIYYRLVQTATHTHWYTFMLFAVSENDGERSSQSRKFHLIPDAYRTISIFSDILWSFAWVTASAGWLWRHFDHRPSEVVCDYLPSTRKEILQLFPTKVLCMRSQSLNQNSKASLSLIGVNKIYLSRKVILQRLRSWVEIIGRF